MKRAAAAGELRDDEALLATWAAVVTPVLRAISLLEDELEAEMGLPMAEAEVLLRIYRSPEGRRCGRTPPVGGGVVRDLLVAEVPAVLRAELYAVAGLGGAAVAVGAQLLGRPAAATAVTGAVLWFGLRLLAIHRGWGLPVARPAAAPADHEETEEER
jgi:hypothetical protein